jgi:nucleotide-binding universal stress UspA family protein
MRFFDGKWAAQRVGGRPGTPVAIAARRRSIMALAPEHARKEVIVVGIEEPAVDHAALEAVREHVRESRRPTLVHLVHVVESTGSRAAPVDRPSSEMAEAEARLALLAEGLHDDTAATVRVHVVTGEPAPTLVRIATEVAADRIVVGTHARRGLARLALGSVADQVLRSAGLPVLVIPTVRRKSAAGSIAPEALVGTIAGAVTGALAGPDGAIAGGVLGAAAGSAAGYAAKAQRKADGARDRELDETIGVTSGSLGAPAKAKELKERKENGEDWDLPS